MDMDNKQIIKKLFELGVKSMKCAFYLNDHGVINDKELYLVGCYALPPRGTHSHDGPDTILYPKWCYEELKFGCNRPWIVTE